MPSERAAKYFADALAAIDLIDAWVTETGGVDQAVYHNELVRSAVERQLLIVSEAAIRLHKLDPGIAPSLAPDIDWPGVRGIGNVLRHKYDDLDTQIIADVLANRLAQLRDACRNALQALQKDRSA